MAMSYRPRPRNRTRVLPSPFSGYLHSFPLWLLESLMSFCIFSETFLAELLSAASFDNFSTTLSRQLFPRSHCFIKTLFFCLRIGLLFTQLNPETGTFPLVLNSAYAVFELKKSRFYLFLTTGCSLDPALRSRHKTRRAKKNPL